MKTFFKSAFILTISVLVLAGCVGITNNPSDTSVIIVGMENSKAYGQCAGCGTDAVKMKKILAPYSKHVTVLQDGAASRAAVKNALLQGSQKDLMIFYYSGHGGQNSKGDPSEADKKDEYLCLNDGALLDNELWSIACGAKGRVMYIIDACHSGTMYRSIGEQLESRGVSARGESPNLLCWSGCHDEQYSYAQNTGGYFTRVICNQYSARYTYDKLWDKIKSSAFLNKHQTPQKTEMGKGWNTFVFH